MSVLHLVRKKYLRDERILQLLLLLSLLRGSPDFAFENYLDLPNLYEADHVLGNALGHTQLSRYSSLTETLHPKSLDRVLSNYQQNVLQDLNLLGNYGQSGRLSINQLGPSISHFDIQAYLLNAENSIGSSQPSSVEGGFVSGPSIAADLNEENPEPRHITSSQATWTRDYTNDPFEELDLLETILKQDIDLGIPRDIYEDFEEEDEESALAISKLDLACMFPSTKDKDHGDEPSGGLSAAEIPDNKDFGLIMNFTENLEAEKLLSKNSKNSFSGEEILDVEIQPVLREPSASASALNEDPFLEFNLDEALKLIGVNSTSEARNFKDCDSDSGCGDSAISESGADHDTPSYLNDLTDSLDEMIQASQLHHQHSRNLQGRLGGLVRSGSMEQRWQDLASLLSLPSPDPSLHAQSPPTPTMASHTTSPVHTHSHTHQPTPVHHPHALYPGHEGVPVCPSRGVLIHNVNPPPPMQDAHNITYANSIGASSHLVASSMNLANNSDLSSHDHQHYKMETSSSLPPDIMYYQNSGPELNQTTDGFLSSILSDEDLQLMDIPMNEYNGRSGGDYGAGSFRYVSSEDPHRIPVVAQKKHQMFGKRFFHENNHGGPPSNNLGAGGNGIGSGPLVNSYTPPYVPTQGSLPMEGATALDPSEMKYSCTMDFRPEVNAPSLVDHVQHNHTYHLSPEGPSGISRSNSRDKKGRKNDNEKSLSRDEKRARSMSLPMNCDDIINLPMDEFNERISKYDLTEAQLSLIRDIRRRGKNKVAAQNCRKRKLDQIVHLAEEVKVIQYRKNELHSQLDHLSSERARIKHKFSLLYKHIFQALRDQEGRPYSPHEYSLQQSPDGNIILVPRSSPSHSLDQLSTKGRNAKDD